VLVCCWSPKGGSGTSVFAAACALTLARDRGGARLGDLDGDQTSILGLSTDPETGLREWLRVGIDAPVDALERLGVPAHGLTLLPAGRAPIGAIEPEVGAALGVALRESDVLTIVDVGVPDAPALEALVDVADASVIVLRSCYLSLRRAVRMPEAARAVGAVLVEDSGRALGSRDVSDVLGVPVLATVPVRASVARVVDAGVFPTRLPDALAKPAREVLTRLGCGGRKGRAA
jgi:cellulose biosynthesis protein BcsQ